MHPAMDRARAVTAKSSAARASGDVAAPTDGPRWEYLVARDATAAALLGPATAPGEAAAVRRQVEALTARAGFVHWWDPTLAKAWVARAVELTSDTERARLDAATYEEQLVAVRDVWGALSAAYRALNIPWTIDAPARLAYTRRTIAAESREWCDTGEWGRVALGFTPGAYVGAEDGGQGCVRIHNRITLDANSDVLDYLRADEFNRDYWSAWGVLPTGRLNVFNWHAFGWHYECATRTGIECDRWVSRLFPPLVWYFDLAAEIARSLHRRGPMRVVAEAARCAFVLNVKSAYEANVLGTAVGDAAAVRLAGLATLQLAQVHVPDETADRVAAGITTAAGLAAAIPGVGTVAAAIIGCFGAAVALFNRLFARVRPVQRDVDAWGRDRPVMEQTYLSGGGGRTEPPTHRVPVPPGWVRPSPLVLGYIPTMAAVEASKASEAERAPGSQRAPSAGIPGAVLVLGLVALLGVAALATRDRWSDSVREAKPWR